jgi:adenylate kinase
MEHMNLIIMGPQGSGKGTQAGLLAQKFNLVQIETGLLFRERAEEKNELGKKINNIIYKKHELVPDEILEKILEKEISKVPKNRGIILDGAPRRENQIKEVEDIFERCERKINHVIFINIPEKESIRRIEGRYECSKCFTKYTMGKDIKSPKEKCVACGGKLERRKDDTEKGILKRLSIFFKETMSVVKYFRKKKMLIEVDGRKNVDEVFASIIKKL